jgi:hypothetical protein
LGTQACGSHPFAVGKTTAPPETLILFPYSWTTFKWNHAIEKVFASIFFPTFALVKNAHHTPRGRFFV